MKRSTRACSTFMGTDPNSKIVSWNARKLNLDPKAASDRARALMISVSPR